MRRIRGYIAVLAWMLVIFVASTDLGSSARTSRLIGPILRWFNSDVTDETIRLVQAFVRKSGHVAEYGILACLVWYARNSNRTVRRWTWREFWMIVAFCALYAVTDEFHQSFVSTRQGSPFDVMIDTVGAAAALLLLWRVGRARNWFQ